jgi:RNA polymerase sigma-70 factor (ECF subfamily)
MAASEPQSPDTPRSVPDPQQATSKTLLECLRANESDACALWGSCIPRSSAIGRRGAAIAAWMSRAWLRSSLQAAATHLQNFRRNRPGDSFRGWLRGIARNMVLQHFRRTGRHPRGSGGTDALVQLHTIEDAAAHEEADEDPAEELDGLRRRALELVRSEFEERTWRDFWMTVVEGRLPADIAAEMGVSPTAIRMAKSRVLRRLKETFGDLIQ